MRVAPAPTRVLHAFSYGCSVRVGLVGCVSEKQTSPAPAASLYTSPLFNGRRQWVERTCDRWFILSALHGLIDPSTTLEPYDLSLIYVGAQQRREWSAQVLAQLDRVLGDLSGLEFEIHAGAAYRDFGLVDGLAQRDATVEVPMAGLGIGQQLGAYSRQWTPDSPAPAPVRRDRSSASAPRPRSGSQASGAYAPLGEYLSSQRDRHRVSLSFREVESILGRALPTSARKHRAWWGNNAGSHSQARSWLNAGWTVANVDLNGARVSFDQDRRHGQ